VKIAIGAGGRLQQGQVLVTVHRRMSGFEDGVVISERAVCSPGLSADPIFVLDGWGDVATVKEEFRGFAGRSLMWTLPDFELPTGVTDKQLCSVLARFMSTGSHHGSPDISGMRVPIADQDIIQALRAAGYVEDAISDGRCLMTCSGVSRMVACAFLNQEFKVFDVRPNIPLADQTAYELMAALQSQGWSWHPWLAKSSRTRGGVDLLAIPDGYKLGDEKRWYSTRCPSKFYMHVLLQSEDLNFTRLSTSFVVSCHHQGFIHKSISHIVFGL
jgi:hypothetical protein